MILIPRAMCFSNYLYLVIYSICCYDVNSSIEVCFTTGIKLPWKKIDSIIKSFYDWLFCDKS